jgi:hypothetical protein
MVDKLSWAEIKVKYADEWVARKKRRETWTTAEPLPGYTLDVHLEALGLDLPMFEVLAQDIAADQFGVEGLIGMDLVEGRILTLNGRSGWYPWRRSGGARARHHCYH